MWETCIVHLIRNSLDFANWKDRKPLAAAIKPIYTEASAEAALAELDAFESGPWGKKFPTVVGAWRRVWDKVIPFFAFPPKCAGWRNSDGVIKRVLTIAYFDRLGVPRLS